MHFKVHNNCVILALLILFVDLGLAKLARKGLEREGSPAWFERQKLNSEEQTLRV